MKSGRECGGERGEHGRLYHHHELVEGGKVEGCVESGHRINMGLERADASRRLASVPDRFCNDTAMSTQGSSRVLLTKSTCLSMYLACHNKAFRTVQSTDAH